MPRGSRPGAGTARQEPLRSIQYLRAAAALAVVAFHALQWCGGGFEAGRAGVDVFFVISGTIMWAITAGRTTAPRAFLWRRITRVAPVYWLATLTVAAIAPLWPAFLPEVRPGLKHLALSLAFIPHLDPRGLPFPTLPPGWSLNYEAIFYLVFAAALPLAETRRAGVVTAVLAALTGLGFLWPDSLYYLGANPMLLQFAAGLWLGRAFVAGRPAPALWGWPLIVGGAAGLLIAALPSVFSELWRPLLWGIPATAMVAGALALEGGGCVARLPWLERLGDASYAIYLWHLPATAVIAHTLGYGRPWLFLPVSLAASIAAGLAAHRWVEIPLIAFLRRIPSKRSIPPMNSIDWTPPAGTPR